MTSSEQLLIDAFKKLNRKSRGCVIPVPQSSCLDQEGIDCVLRIFSYPFWLSVQVKPSDTGETVGIVLPLPEPLPPDLEKKITLYVRAEIQEHIRKHPEVIHLLFVGRPNSKRSKQKPRSRDMVLDDVYRETKKMFRVTAERVFRKSFKK